jgi:hypothetical protein
VALSVQKKKKNTMQPYNKEENKVHYLEFPNFGRREFLGSLAELIMHALPSYHWKFHAHG